MLYGSGAGGYGWFGRFKVGGEGNYFIGKNKHNQKMTQVQVFGGNFYTSYLINPNSKVHFLPLIALGGESINLLANKNITTDILQALQNPQTLQVQTGSFYLKIALQVEYKIRKNVMGVQIGHQFSSNQEWQLYENSSSNAPSDRLSNFFLRITFGLE